jgi:hypothetical protein
MCTVGQQRSEIRLHLVKLPIVGTKPRARPVINHFGVTNVARLCQQEKPSSIVSLCIPGTRIATLWTGANG